MAHETGKNEGYFKVQKQQTQTGLGYRMPSRIHFLTFDFSGNRNIKTTIYYKLSIHFPNKYENSLKFRTKTKIYLEMYDLKMNVGKIVKHEINMLNNIASE